MRSVIGYLVKEEDTDFEGFCKRVQKQNSFLERVEAVPLYKEEFSQIEKFVKELQALAVSECEDFQKLRADLLYRSNTIHKQRNQRKYKKDKHSKSKFSDWD